MKDKVFLFRYFSFPRTLCYYPKAGWSHIVLFIVLLNEDAG